MSGQMIIREWNGKNISQRDDGYLSATDMCKACGKNFSDWNRLDSSKKYLKALESSMGITASDAVQVFQGSFGESIGSWVHKLVALEVARWLSPEFSIQCNIWVEELMLKGTVSTNNQELEGEKMIEEIKISSINGNILDELLGTNKDLFEDNQELKVEIIQLRGFIAKLQKDELTRRVNGCKDHTQRFLELSKTLLRLAYEIPSRGSIDEQVASELKTLALKQVKIILSEFLKDEYAENDVLLLK